MPKRTIRKDGVPLLIYPETREMLRKITGKGETWDKVINRLIQFYEDNEKVEK